MQPLPQDFITFAPGKSQDHLCKHYRIGKGTLRMWRKISGVTEKLSPGRISPGKLPIPANFQRPAPSMSINAARTFWGVSWNTAQSWYTDAGIKPGAPAKPVFAPRPTRKKAPRKSNYGLPQAVMSQADTTTAGEAARFLMRLHANVHRMSIYDAATRRARGIFDDGRNHFSVSGVGILTADEVIVLAVRKGWQRMAVAA